MFVWVPAFRLRAPANCQRAEARVASGGGSRGRAEICSSGRCHGDSRFARLLMLKMEPVERGVASTLAQQFVVAAGFRYLAALDHMDAVGMRNGVQPMRDGERRAAFAQVFHGLAH